MKHPCEESNLCDCSDAYIVVKGTITVQTQNNGAIQMECIQNKLSIQK